MTQKISNIDNSYNQAEADYMSLKIELPLWAIKRIDELASDLSIDTNSLIRRWVLDRLKQEG